MSIQCRIQYHIHFHGHFFMIDTGEFDIQYPVERFKMDGCFVWIEPKRDAFNYIMNKYRRIFTNLEIEIADNVDSDSEVDEPETIRVDFSFDNCKGCCMEVFTDDQYAAFNSDTDLVQCICRRQLEYLDLIQSPNSTNEIDLTCILVEQSCFPAVYEAGVAARLCLTQCSGIPKDVIRRIILPHIWRSRKDEAWKEGNAKLRGAKIHLL